MPNNGKTPPVQQQENSKFWLAVFIAVPVLFVIAGVLALTTSFKNGSAGTDNPANQGNIEYAKTFDFRADINIDGSVLNVTISANTPAGPENLIMELQNKSKQELFHQVRLINAGNNLYRGTLPEVEYGVWKISLYPDSSLPIWRIDNMSVFPNNIVSIAARK